MNTYIPHKRKVPKKVMQYIEKNQRKYGENRTEAIESALNHYKTLNRAIYAAWHCGEYREFFPEIIAPEYLDFSKYPLCEGYVNYITTRHNTIHCIQSVGNFGMFT